MPTGFILAFVGASGSGKTTLIMELLRRMPDVFFPVVSYASRARRGPEDDVFYKFTTADVIRGMRDRGELVQSLEYAGNIYGCTKVDIDSAVSRGIGVQAFVENAIFDLQRAGYDVRPIKIVADTVQSDTLRQKEDEARSRIELPYVATIHNSFAPGGKERAVQELIDFVQTLDGPRVYSSHAAHAR